MNIKKEEIIKYGVAILAVLNLIWLFGFQYRLPGKAADSQKVEEADSTTAEAVDVATTAEASDTAATAVEIEVAVEEEPEEDAEPEENVVRCRVTGTNKLNIREGPGTSYIVVATANYNEILIVLGFENGWIHVRNDDGLEGYVSEKYVEIVENQPE